MANPVLEDAISVEEQAVHAKVNISNIGTVADSILERYEDKPYTSGSWASAPLHPNPQNYSSTFITNWIVLVSSINFSFWSTAKMLDDNYDNDSKVKSFGIWKGTDSNDSDGRDKKQKKFWTGYWSILAVLWRAIDEGYDITNPRYYANASAEELRYIMRSDSKEEFPLVEERIKVIWETGRILCKKYDANGVNLIKAANGSAMKSVKLLTDDFKSFRDECEYRGRIVHFYKRAQILVAEIWAAFDGQGLGKFHDIDKLTMFADYRVPQNLLSLGCITYSKELLKRLWNREILPYGSVEEVEIRAASIAGVERIQEAIVQRGGPSIDAVVLDFILWDWAKEKQQQESTSLHHPLGPPHHLTRSIYY